jgi:hypothetical protein
MNEEPLILVPIPPLAAILFKRETDKGSPLTQSEVEEIRDNCVCMTMRASVARKMAESRGYEDINLENAWNDWQSIRTKL